METAAIRAFCHEYARAWERGDIPALLSCYTDDCEILTPIFNVLSGRAQLEASFRELFRVFSEYIVEVEDVIVDREGGERAVLVFSTFATHRGEIFGVAGSGRRFEIRGAFIFTFANGLIARDVRLYDFSGMLMQLGVLRTKGL
jgi:steroid delta-isomerase-like uncharacterized protein